MKRNDSADTLLLHIRAYKLPTPVCEYKFHKTMGSRFDLAWPDRMIAVECDGGTNGFWQIKKDGTRVRIVGRHSYGAGYDKDCIKINEATRLGWKVYRFSSAQVRKGIAINYIKEIIK